MADKKIRVSLKKAPITLKAHRQDFVDQDKRTQQQDAIASLVDLIKKGQYNKQDIAKLSLSAERYAKGSSDITAKELLKFYAEAVNRADMGKQSDYSPQDKANILLLVEIISGLAMALRTYEAIIKYNDERGKDSE